MVNTTDSLYQISERKPLENWKWEKKYKNILKSIGRYKKCLTKTEREYITHG